jgi:hypothetical protein
VVVLLTLAVTSCFVESFHDSDDRLWGPADPFFVLLCSMCAVMPQDLKAGFRFFDSKKLRGIEAPQPDTVSSLMFWDSLIVTLCVANSDILTPTFSLEQKTRWTLVYTSAIVETCWALKAIYHCDRLALTLYTV